MNNQDLKNEIKKKDLEIQDLIKKLENKNEIYNNELDVLTAKVFEVCADKKYIDNNGDTYNEFLSKPIKIKMLEDIEYDWMVEGCEDEYQNYPIKFKLKYS